MKKYYFLLINLIIAFALRVGVNNAEMLSVLLGVSIIPAVWFLVKVISKDKSSLLLANISSLFISLSPWIIPFVKYDWRVNFYLLLSVVAFIICIYFYQKLALDKYFKREIILLILALSFCLLIFFVIKNGPIQTQVPIWITDEQRREHGDFESPFVVLIHNKVINYSLSFFEHYFKHFSGEYLFVTGDTNQQIRVKDFGQMYLVDALFIIVGFFVIFRNLKYWKAILLLLIFSPLLSALDLQPPNAVRSQLMVIPLSIISALGAINIFYYLHSKKGVLMQYGLFALLGLLIIWDFGRFLHQLFFHMTI